MTITKKHVAANQKKILRTADVMGCSQAEAVCIMFVGLGEESNMPLYGQRHLWAAAKCLDAIQRDRDYHTDPTAAN